MNIYDFATHECADFQNETRLIELFDAAFSNSLTHEKVIEQIEEKTKREIEEKTACEEKKIAKKIAKKLTKKIFKQTEEKTKRKIEKIELKIIAKINRKIEKKTQRQTEKTALKIIARVNRKTERQTNKKIKKEIEIQQLKIFILQINEMFYSSDFISVLAFMKISIQEVSDKKHVIVMTMKIENLKLVEEILISEFNM